MSKKAAISIMLLGLGAVTLGGRLGAQELEDLPVPRRRAETRQGTRRKMTVRQPKPTSRKTQDPNSGKAMDPHSGRPELGVPVGGDQEVPKPPKDLIDDKSSPRWLDNKKTPAAPGRSMAGRGLRDFLNRSTTTTGQGDGKNAGREISPLKGPWVEDLGAGGAVPDFLDRVLDKLGGYASFQAMNAFEVQRSMSAVNEEGSELFYHQFWHKVELGRGMPVDEILWSPGFRFGRRGARAWARFAEVDRPDLAESTHLETLGWSQLARFPFCFRDRTRYRVLPEEKVQFMERSLIKLRIVERVSGKNSPKLLMGSANKKSPSERYYDLFLDPQSLVPLFMEMQRNGGQRRIQMSRYKSPFAGAPRMPHERTVLAEDGETPSLEIRWDIVKKAKVSR